MKSTTLTRIETCFNRVDGDKLNTVGIFFYFKDREEPISYGKISDGFWAAEFNESQPIKTIKLSKHMFDGEGDCRFYTFYDTTGKKLAKWKHTDGKDRQSTVPICQSSMPTLAPGCKITIPDGHEIVGFAVEINLEGYITWIDFKTWKPPMKF